MGFKTVKVLINDDGTMEFDQIGYDFRFVFFENPLVGTDFGHGEKIHSGKHTFGLVLFQCLGNELAEPYQWKQSGDHQG